ncbi:MAG: hypothetical protein JSW00_17580 [Thermoplasmata archaeon]|nr:MAG: hypothetical protein JSW00_17580 [Thermoplasmata archaeon]
MRKKGSFVRVKSSIDDYKELCRSIFTYIIVGLFICMELFIGAIYADDPFEPNVRVNELVIVPSTETQSNPSVGVDNAGNIYVAWGDFRESNYDIYFSKSTDGGNTFSVNKRINDDNGERWQYNPSIAVGSMGNIYIIWVDERSGKPEVYFAKSTDGGNTFSVNKRVNDGAGNVGQDSLSISVDGIDNIYIVWMDTRNFDTSLYFSKSTDGGNTFSANKKVNDITGNSWREHPSIAIDSTSNIYVTWMDERSGNADIYFAKSTDGGTTFSNNKKINDDAGNAEQFTPSIGVGESDNIFIAWGDFRDSNSDIYFTSSNDGGNSFSPNKKVNDDVSNTKQYEPSIAIDNGGNIYLAWTDQRNGNYNIYFANSTDGGNSFSPNKMVNDDGGPSQFQPSIAIDNEGNIYLAWTDQRNGNYDIYFASSTDGGNSFSPNKMVNDDVSIPRQYEPSMAIGNNGNIYLAWADERNGDSDIYFASSTDGGNSFSPNKKVSDDTVNMIQLHPSIAIDGADNIYIAWWDYRHGFFGDIYFAKSTDGGNSFSANKKVNDDVMNAAQDKPSIAVDGLGNIYIAWGDNRSGNYDIYLATSTDGGNSFSVNKKVNDDVIGAKQKYPSIVADSAGNIYITWMDDRSGNYDIYFARSTDGGNTFSTNKKVNDDSGDNRQTDPCVTVDTLDNIYIAWRDGRNGNYDIYFTRTTDGGNTFSINKKVNDDAGNNDQRDPCIAVDRVGNIYIAFRDDRNGDYDIYFAKSTDGGNTFSPNKRVNDDIGSNIQLSPSIGVDDGGYIYIAWEDRRNGSGDIYLTSTGPILALLITEIQDSPDGNEWIEVYNPALAAINLQDYKISLDYGTTFIDGSWSNPLINFGEYSIWTPTVVGLLNDEGALISIHNFTHPKKSMFDVVGYGQNGIAPDPVAGESCARYWDTINLKYKDSWSRNESTGPSPGAVNNNPEVNPTPLIMLNEVSFYPFIPQYGFIELIYIGDNSIDISNYKIVCDSEYIIPGGTILSKSDPFFGVNQLNYPSGFDLDDGVVNGDNVYLYDDTGALLDMVGWNSSHLQGMSVRRIPDGYGTYQGYNDTTSEAAGWVFNIPLKVQVSEISDNDSMVAQIEVYNPRYPFINFNVGFSFESASSGTLAGVWSISTANEDGYALFNVTTPNGLNTEGDNIRFYLYDVLIEEISYGQKGVVPDPLTGESTARYWNTTLLEYTSYWNREKTPTFGAQNDVLPPNLNPSVVLNEIMFNPSSPEDGFVEIYLKFGWVDITGYKIVGDSEYIFPQVTELPSDDHLYYITQPMDPGFFAALNPSGDNVYLYDDYGSLLDMAGWSSSHQQGKTMCRIPEGNGTFDGFNDTSSIAAGWIFGCSPTIRLIDITANEIVKIGNLSDVLYFNLTITNMHFLNDTFPIFNFTINGYSVAILDNTLTYIIDEIFLLARSSVDIKVKVKPILQTPVVGWDNITITIQSENNSLYWSIIILQVFVICPPVADAGQDQIVYESAIVYFDGTESYDPDYHWHKLDVNFATDSALYLRTIDPIGPEDGAWEGGVQEWVNFTSPFPFWIGKKSGHLGQGPTGHEYTYYWKMHETGNFTLYFSGRNGDFYANVSDETDGIPVISGLFVQNSDPFIEIVRQLYDGHIYRLDIYDTVSKSVSFPKDLDVIFKIKETEILLTPNRDSLVYYISQNPLDMAVEGPGVRDIQFYSRSIQEFYAYYALKLDHSEVEFSGGELGSTDPPYNTGIAPSEYKATTLNISDELIYLWDFDADFDSDGDGNLTNDIDATGLTPIHIYGDNWLYTVTLTVIDVQGLSDIDICYITVNNAAPTIEPFGPFTVYRGDPLTIDANATDLGSDDLTFTWEFESGPTIMNLYYNDGVGLDPYPSPWGIFPFSRTDTVQHTYDAIGIYTINLTVEDDDGGISYYTTTIVVINIPILPPILFINVSQDGKDVILYWDPPSIPDLDHYLIYRSTSQISFDFNKVWVDTSIDNETGEPGPIPLRTMWNDTYAAFLGDETNYEEEYYYIIRAVNSFGEVSATSRTVGKWTKSFPKGVSTFSLPLEPIEPFYTDYYTSTMNTQYIKYMDSNTHRWRQHNFGDQNTNNTEMKLGEGYEVKFDSQTIYTFTGLPAAMISYNDDNGFTGFNYISEAKSLMVEVLPNGDVNLTWQEPASMGIGDWYEIYYSNTTDGFFGTFNKDYFLLCAPIYFRNFSATHINARANDPGARSYYLVVPFSASGIRGASTYSIGIWTEEYTSGYDTLAIPLKLKDNYTADWYCDNIPNTEGINYFDISKQRWYWHSTIMPVGAFDTNLVMTQGYQISTSDTTKFTFIGV